MKNFLKCLLSILLFSQPIIAQTVKKAEKAQAGYYRMKFGDYEIIALSDGTLPLPIKDILLNTAEGQVEKLLAKNHITKPEASINAYLINTGSKLILIDAGTSELYGPSLGFLPNSIRAAGYQPEDIDMVLITHIHTDHTGGLMDGNHMVFPNAKIYISKAEVDFWLGKGQKEKAAKRLAPFFDEAHLKVAPYLKAGKVVTFNYDQEIFPGILPIATPGHTPGHSFFSLENKGEKMMFWGDIMHVAEVQFSDPGVAILFDVDPVAAVLQRKKAYAEAAEKGYWIASDHISFPGIGHIRAEGTGYVWIPISYSYQ